MVDLNGDVVYLRIPRLGLELLKGAVVQLGERLTGSQKVVGSSPIGSTSVIIQNRNFFMVFGKRKKEKELRPLEVRVVDDNLNRAISHLKRIIAREGLLKELKKRRHYEKPGIKRRRKQRDAARRRRRELSRLRKNS